MDLTKKILQDDNQISFKPYKVLPLHIFRALLMQYIPQTPLQIQKCFLIKLSTANYIIIPE